MERGDGDRRTKKGRKEDEQFGGAKKGYKQRHIVFTLWPPTMTQPASPIGFVIYNSRHAGPDTL